MKRSPTPPPASPGQESYCYENGIADYVREAAGADPLTPVFTCESEATAATGRTSPTIRCG